MTLKFDTIHTPTGEEYGDTPTREGSKVKVKVLCVSTQGPDFPPIWGDMPAELPKVCPNMPALVKVTGATGKGQGTFHLFDGTKQDLAAWKAVRTKRHTNRADQGSYQLDPRRAAEPVDPGLSEAAQKAWATRRANAETKAAEG